MPEPVTDPLAAELAKLAPIPAALDRDRLLFAAGAASRTGTVRLWQATAGFLTAVGFAFGYYCRTPPTEAVNKAAAALPAPPALPLPKADIPK